MDAPRIPIRNLYYLLCYAWNQLPQGELVDVSRVPTTELVDLFALVLCDGIQHLVRRGMEQGYEPREEEIAGVRGRMDILQSVRRFLPAHGRAACRFDEMTSNTLANRILKSTLGRLMHVAGLDDGLRKRVHGLYRDLHGIHEITVTSHSFRQVQLHANNRFYRFLLNVCELIHGAWLVDQEAGTYRFRDFDRDERIMARVFQDFLYNFIRIEVPSWTVERQYIRWQATSISDPELSLLPRMETDISLKREGQHKIIDAKYYQETLVQRFDQEKIHSAHLCQLFAYLANAGRKPGMALTGMLLYPQVGRHVCDRYVLLGYPVTIATVDLGQSWEKVRQQLLELVE